MLVTGATVRSRFIDVMVDDDLVIESVIDEITKAQEGISIGLSAAMVMGDGALRKIAGLGDMAFSDRETKRRWIEQKTALIATEQLYLTVGKTFVTRSAEARREGSIQAPDYYAVDNLRQSLHLYEREMPNYEDGSAFFALDLHGRGEAEELLEEQGIELLEGEPTLAILDTLATIQGSDLKIYEQDTTDKGKLVLVHAFKGGDDAISLVHVATDPRRPGVLNHFNRLETTQDFTKAAHRVEEHFEEEYGAVVTEEGYDVSLPFTAVATFAGNVYDFCHYVMEQNATFNPNSTVAEALTAPGVDVSSNPQTMESIKNSVVDALRENGATDSDIQTILSDPGIASLIQAGAKFDALDKDFRTIDILTRNPDGTFSGPSSTGPSRFGKVIESGLSVMCSAAATLSDFNEAHPTLTNLAILSVQTALSGPTQFVKSYALERSGIQGAIDQQVDAGTAWINDKLVNQLYMDTFYADILTEGGKFGFVIGAGMLGAGSKDKIVDSAKGVADKIKKISREQRWVELANKKTHLIPKEMVNHIRKNNGKNVSKIYGYELAHKPKRSAARGVDYSEALPKTIADHRGLEHRFLKERKTGTVISKPKSDRSNNSLSLPKSGKLPE